jgi:hypothetical protein
MATSASLTNNTSDGGLNNKNPPVTLAGSLHLLRLRNIQIHETIVTTIYINDLDATTLRWTTAIMRHRRHILNLCNLDAKVIERTDS